MKDLSGKVALVTGGSAGIGLSVAHKLAAAGARLALVARTQAKLDEAAAQVGKGAIAITCDVSDLPALGKLPGRVVERLGGLDIVVNNAGVNHRGPIRTRTADELAQVILTNLTAPIYLTRAVQDVIRPGGAIVNVASLAGFVPVHHQATYSASKAGLRAFSRAVAEELWEKKVTVSLVSPGPVDTDFFGDLEKVPDLVFSQPMRTPDQVAEAVMTCIEEGNLEIVMPSLSGKLATLGYLFPSLERTLRPFLLKRGAKNKRRLIERRAAKKE